MCVCDVVVILILIAKYGRVAEQSNLRFVPAVFSHTGQIHGEFRAFVKEQIGSF